MNIVLDEGYLFGMGAFETVSVQGCPVFLDRHLARLERALAFLDIPQRVTEAEVYQYLEKKSVSRGALKIVVSRENRLFLLRENPYGTEAYEKGFVVDFAQARRNERSSFTYHKTTQYGDCIMEKRRAVTKGLHEAIFLNSLGEICEGTMSNIFFVRDGQIVTPAVFCGLLPGIMRRYVMEHNSVKEARIPAEEIVRYDECFVTNSLLGIMPVVKWGEHIFAQRETADRLRKAYQAAYGTPPGA